MSNNFLNFSLSVALRTDEEKQWCKDALDFLSEFLWGNIDEKEDDLTPREKSILTEVQPYIGEDGGWGEMDDGLNFEWGVSEDDNGVKELHIYAEESGTPASAATFLQIFLRKFRPEEGIWFSWSFTSSKMRVNEFSGAACAITAKEILYYDPIDLAQSFLKNQGLVEEGSNFWRKK